MSSPKRKYIEATYQLLVQNGLGGVSIRKVADSVGCTSAAIYKHFRDINHLVALASVRFLSDYSSDARIISRVELNPLELNLQLWECLAYYSFKDAPIIEKMFFEDGNQGEVYHATTEYYEQFPEELEEMSNFMSEMLKGESMMKRDSILLIRSAEQGIITPEGADYLCRLDTHLFQGMLASIRHNYHQSGVARATTREFMNLIVHSYSTQLLPGYKILVNKPAAPCLAMDKYEIDMDAYRVSPIGI